jgi:hypothetical protein
MYDLHVTGKTLISLGFVAAFACNTRGETESSESLKAQLEQAVRDVRDVAAFVSLLDEACACRTAVCWDKVWMGRYPVMHPRDGLGSQAGLEPYNARMNACREHAVLTVERP